METRKIMWPYLIGLPSSLASCSFSTLCCPFSSKRKNVLSFLPSSPLPTLTQKVSVQLSVFPLLFPFLLLLSSFCFQTFPSKTSPNRFLLHQAFTNFTAHHPFLYPLFRRSPPSQLPPWQDGHLICHTSHATWAWKPSLTPPKNEVLSSSSRDDMKYLFVLLIKTKIIKRGKWDLGGVCFLTE